MITLPRRLIEQGFYLLYYPMAWIYDFVAWSVSFGQWAEWRRLALLFLHPGPTLELAFGTGAFFADMIEAGYNPIGVDLSPYMARLAGRRLRRKKLPLNLSRAKAQSLPFLACHFTNVVATFPTDYMLEPATIAEIWRVLGKGGRLVIVFEGQLRGPWPIHPFIDWLYEITGQRNLPPLRPLDLFTASHLEARWEIVERAGASARLLIADKYA